METYYESAEGLEITRGRVILEFDRHGIIDPATEMQEFIETCGFEDNQEIFPARKVLEWLGY